MNQIAIQDRMSPEQVYNVHKRLKQSQTKRGTLSAHFIDPTKFDGVINTSSTTPHLDKTVSPRKQDFLTMAHARVTKPDGSTQDITEYNGGVSFELSRGTALAMEVGVINQNFRIFFSFTPRFYYILPWRLRLIPQVNPAEDE